ncbi:MAG: hypothetical protein QXW65_02745, partial [Candidatus Pacearchaeota archaeon]
MKIIRNLCLFLTISLILVSFALFFFIPNVKAQIGCCEVTINGSYCQEVEQNKCSSGFIPTLCDNTFHCRRGCCVTDSGCSLNTPRKLCTGNSTFYENAACNVESCKKVCCIINSTHQIKSKLSCEQEARRQGLVPVMFDTSNQTICDELYNTSNKGCCKLEGVCKYSTLEWCMRNRGEFKANQYCSQVCLECTRHAKKGCKGNEIYYFDSCNNPEEVYMACNKDQVCAMIGGEARCVRAGCTFTHSNKSTISYNVGDAWCDSDDSSSKDDPRRLVGWNDRAYFCMWDGTKSYINVIPLDPRGYEICKVIDGRVKKFRNDINCTSYTDKESCESNGLCMWVDNFVEFRVLRAIKIYSHTLGSDIFPDWQTDVRGFEKAACIPKYPPNDDSRCSEGTVLHGSAPKDRKCTWSERVAWGDDWRCHPTAHSRCYIGGGGSGVNLGSECIAKGFLGADCVHWNDDIKELNSISFYKLLQNGSSHILDNVCDSAIAVKEDKVITSEQREAIWATAEAKRCRNLGMCGAYENIAGDRGWVGARLKKYAGYVPGPGGSCNVESEGKVGVYTFYDPENRSPYCFKVPFSGWAVRIVDYYFYCEPWQAPPGGDKCYKCNEDPLRPCNPIRCKVLGQLCEFNENTGECIGGEEIDNIPPEIITCTKTLSYSNSVSPCEINVEVENWESVNVTMYTNEDAQCIYSEGQPPNLDFENPDFFFGTNGYTSMHTMVLRYFPQEEDSVKVLTYICQDKAGNKMAEPKQIRLTIKKLGLGDNRPPEILRTSPPNGSYMPSGITNLTLYVVANEPCFCRWSANDVAYEQMGNDFNVTDSMETFFYGETNLTLQQGIVNYFYIGCNDTAGNRMQQNYQLVLYPAPLLFITSIEPKAGSIVGSCGSLPRTKLTVITDGGINNGKATCSWRNVNAGIGEWRVFDETGGIEHSTNITVVMGANTVDILCHDSANIVLNSTTFTVEKDETQPKITRIYKEGSRLVLRTDENATCA